MTIHVDGPNHRVPNAVRSSHDSFVRHVDPHAIDAHAIVTILAIPIGIVQALRITSPYNVRIGGHAVSAGRHREFAMASGEMSEAEFRSFLADTLGAAARCSRDGAVHFVCMDWRHMDDVSAVGRTVYGDCLNLCVWNKSNAGMGSLYRSKHELVFVYRVGTVPILIWLSSANMVATAPMSGIMRR
jgi:hypothetical protein